MKNSKSLLGLLITIFGVFFLILFLMIIYFIYHNPIPEDKERKIQIEIIKSLLQLLIVIGIGGIVGLLFKKVEKFQELLKIQTGERIDFMNRLKKIYLDVKSCRRTLIFNGLTNKYGSSPKELSENMKELYKTQMEIISEKQLDLEALKSETKILPSKDHSNIENQIGLMERYLRKIHNEFEMNYSLSSISFEKLIYLQEFTGPTKDKGKEEDLELNKYRLKKELSAPYYHVLNILSNSKL